VPLPAAPTSTANAAIVWGRCRAGLPVGLALDGPESNDHQLLAIGCALETLPPPLPAPRIDSSLAPAGQAGYGWTC
jgi:Asp-tRNA(Asn)/Glu-tRNA(Gln) amidotransferase A subunit family amidase